MVGRYSFMYPNTRKTVLTLAFSAMCLCAGPAHAQAPTITGISPTSGPVGTVVQITGSGFGTTQGTSTVSLNGTSATVVGWSVNILDVLIPSGATSGSFSVTVNSQSANSSVFTVTALPSGWSEADVGSVGVSGSGSYANGVFTVKGAGLGTFSTTSDGINFAYQSLSGDGTIVARVVSSSSSSAQAGVMIRETLDPGAKHEYAFYYSSSPYQTYRTSTGGSSSYQGCGSVTLPYWVKLTRSGSSFTEYGSADGVNWVQVCPQTITMATNVYIGLAVSSRSTSTLATATFDNVSISSSSAPAPTITGVTATTGSVGSQVVISGTGFASAGLVTLNGALVTLNLWSSTSIAITIPSGATSGPLAVSAAPSMNCSNPVTFTVTSQPLPSGWLDQDVGQVGVAGSATYSNGVFTVKGAGLGTFSTSTDGIHFAYQTLSGDGTIVARVVSSSSSSAQAGVMIRETLDPGAKHEYAFYYSSSLYQTYRTSTGGASSYQGCGSVTLPYWVKLTRSGSSFTEYGSADGVNWVQVCTQTITMATNGYIALAVSSRSTSTLATATFDNVSISSSSAPAPTITGVTATTGSVGSQVVISGTGFASAGLVTLNGALVTLNLWSSTSIAITIPSGATSGPLAVSAAPSMNCSNPVTFTVTSQPLPSGWLDQDVGQVGVAGSANYSNGVVTGKGAGVGTFFTSTGGIHFAYQTLSGDGTIVARVVSSSSSSAQAGVMIRETLDPGAKHEYAFYYSSRLYQTYRTSTGGASSYQGGGSGTLPYWVKLTRVGSRFTEYGSADGVNWVQVCTQTITMATNVYIGLAVSSRSTSTLATATFDNVSVTSTTAPAPAITNVSATTGSVASQVVITGTGFGSSQGSSLVTLNNAAVTINYWTTTAIIISIPTGATSGPLVVTVAPNMDDSNPVYFTVTTQPLPVSWLDQDVGSVGVAGSATYATGTFTVKGAGVGSFGNAVADAVHFVYQPLSGDGTIVMRVASVSSSSAQAGVMIRETLDAGAKEIFASRYSSSIYLTERTTAGGSSTYQACVSPSLPYWLKLIRSGSTFYAYGSTDGVSWAQICTTQTISMATNVYVGLAVNSNNTTALATATFDNVSLTVGPRPFVTGVSPDLGPLGTSVTITGSNFGSSQGTSTVSFNGAQATSVPSGSSAQTVATVPATAPSGPGTVTVTVNSIQSVSSASFTVINPIISSLSPPNAAIGATVTLTGSGFGPSQSGSQVKFNGVVTGAYSWSNTSISAVVPTNTTSGPVTLTEDGVVSNSVQFTVEGQPTITTLSPGTAPTGASVTINGSGFGATQSSSTVNFYGGTASATSWSDTQIVAAVPPTAS